MLVQAAILLLLSSCAADDSRQARPSQGIRPAGPIGSAVGSENGLEVRKVVLQDEDGAIAHALVERGDVYTAEGAERFGRNGFLLVRLDASAVDALLADLGAPLTDVRTWHGQAPEWRDLARTPARTPVAAVVDGRPRVFADGSLRLLLRAWTLPTEEGASLELQLQAKFQPVMRGPVLLADAEGDDRSQRVGGSTELHLEPGDSWILTCTVPRDEAQPAEDQDVRRDGLPARAVTGTGANATEETSGDTSRRRASPRGPVPDDPFGPGASLPPTLGALLLSTEIPATRTLFVLTPRLPDVARAERPELDPGADPAQPMPDATALPEVSTPDSAPVATGEARLRGGER